MRIFSFRLLISSEGSDCSCLGFAVSSNAASSRDAGIYCIAHFGTVRKLTDSFQRLLPLAWLKLEHLPSQLIYHIPGELHQVRPLPYRRFICSRQALSSLPSKFSVKRRIFLQGLLQYISGCFHCESLE